MTTAEATDIAGAAEEADRFRIQLGGAAGASERHPWQELAGGGSIVRRTSGSRREPGSTSISSPRAGRLRPGKRTVNKGRPEPGHLDEARNV